MWRQELTKEDSEKVLSEFDAQRKATVSRERILTSSGAGHARHNEHAQHTAEEEIDDSEELRRSVESYLCGWRFLESVTAGMLWIL